MKNDGRLLYLATLLLAASCLSPARARAIHFNSPTLDALAEDDSDARIFDGVKPSVDFAPRIKPAWKIPNATNRPIVIAGIDNNLEVLLLNELGNPPSPSEEQKLRIATDILKSSKVGVEISALVGKTDFPAGSWEGLRKAGVEITTRDLNRHIPIIDAIASRLIGSTDYPAATPRPSWVRGRTIVCLDTEKVANASPAILATLLAHELSHVADNRTVGEGRTGTRLISEQKAAAVQVMMVDELLRTGVMTPDPTSNLQFLASIYRWKLGGPKPNMKFIFRIGDKPYTGEQLIALHTKPGDNALQAIMRLGRFAYPELANELPPKDDPRAAAQYAAQFKALTNLEAKFEQWYPTNPPPTQPPPSSPTPQPPHQSPPPPDNDDHQGGGGGGIDPHPPMPSPDPWGGT